MTKSKFAEQIAAHNQHAIGWKVVCEDGMVIKSTHPLNGGYIATYTGWEAPRHFKSIKAIREVIAEVAEEEDRPKAEVTEDFEWSKVVKCEPIMVQQEAKAQEQEDVEARDTAADAIDTPEAITTKAPDETPEVAATSTSALVISEPAVPTRLIWRAIEEAQRLQSDLAYDDEDPANAAISSFSWLIRELKQLIREAN